MHHELNGCPSRPIRGCAALASRTDNEGTLTPPRPRPAEARPWCREAGRHRHLLRGRFRSLTSAWFPRDPLHCARPFRSAHPGHSWECTMLETFVKTYGDRPYRFPAMLRHNGVLLAFAMDG